MVINYDHKRKDMIRETSDLKSIDIAQHRYLSIDVFKGLSVLLMVFANTFSPYENVPAWTQHAVDFGLTYVDLVASFFVFMLALNFKISFMRRMELKGKKKAYFRFIRRYIIFIGLGLLLTMYVGPDGFYLRWGTLQILGTAGLILLFLINLKTYLRLIISLLMLVAHQILLMTELKIVIYDAIEGGIFGMLSWTAMMLLSSCIADGLGRRKIKEYFFYGGVIFILSGIIINCFITFSRAYISLSYTLFSVGISSLLYYLIYLIFEVHAKKKVFLTNEKLFSVVGKNAFILYLSDFIIAFSTYYLVPWDSPAIFIFVIAFLSVLSIWFIAYLMNRVQMYIVI